MDTGSAPDDQRDEWRDASDRVASPESVAESDVTESDAALPDVALPASESRTGSDGSARSSTPTSVEAQLDALAELPLAQHADVFERVHQELRSTLAGIDDA